jgi:hypothetical protein
VPKYEPIAGLIAVESLEDEAEEAAEAGQPGDEAEMCEVVAVHDGARFSVGQIVLVEPTAYHYATKFENALFVREECVLAVVTK